MYQVTRFHLTTYYTCVIINTIVQPKRVASKPTRNGYVHPTMFHLAVIATTLSCIEAQSLLDKMNEFRVEEETRAEMISVVIEETPHCWDANAD